MKRFVTAVLCLCVAIAASAGTPSSVQFSGLVRSNDGMPTRFDLDVPTGQQVTLIMGDGTRLELAASGRRGHARTPMAQLVSAKGKVLHTATFTKHGVAVVSLDYVVCGKRVMYVSPAPSTMPSCHAG
ncbi:hypothetical protein [Dyella sp. A6]|uniref:hypothetical protein n=1 Tax=Dyella aluminiiresistens TaxID=3069105 RepID=UPI002E75C827|nr:hypothetical protein [Dyella sp. A6]